MITVTWQPDRNVRAGFYAFRLCDPTGKMLARVGDSTNTFRKAGDYSLGVWVDGVCLRGEGQWPGLRAVLVRLFPDHDIEGLELPTRPTPQDLTPDAYYR